MAAVYTNSENQPQDRVFGGPPQCNGYQSATLDDFTQPLTSGPRTVSAVNYVVLTAITGTAATTKISATPTIHVGFEGEVIVVANVTASASIALQDNSIISSGILLGAKRYVIGPGRFLTLQWSANWGSLWKRVDTSLNNASPNIFAAHAGGGQANATVLNNNWNVVTTVASAGDSVKVDWTPTGAGWQYLISNLGAQPMTLYPLTGDAFNNLAANDGISIAPGTSVTLIDYAANLWLTI